MLYLVDRLTRDVGCYFSVLGIYFVHTTERKILRMKFNEKLIEIRKKQGLSQEELGMELQVSRQTISKWETGQSYPDFQRLVMLSDYFNMTLDELVKGIDVQDVREKNMTDERVASIYLDIENGKTVLKKSLNIICYIGLVLIILCLVAFLAHLAFPNIEWLWKTGM